MTGALVTATKSESVKAACQGAIPWPDLATIPWHLLHNTMLCYYPYEGASERITWHGGQSTKLHHEVEVDDCYGNPCWIEREVQTLGGGIPTGTKELLAAMSDYYQHITTMHLDNLYATIF